MKDGQKVTQDWQEYIHSDPEILLGKPVVKGTRLAVDFPRAVRSGVDGRTSAGKLSYADL